MYLGLGSFPALIPCFLRRRQGPGMAKKDVIATFNWNLLLLQAYIRCYSITDNLSHILCLYGNVAMGYCEEHGEFGIKTANCPICMRKFSPTKLLYPVAQKDYESDAYIHNCWEAVQQATDHYIRIQCSIQRQKYS